MSTHPIDIQGMGPMELARRCSKLRYDVLRDFLGWLQYFLLVDAQADELAGRPMLANFLRGTAKALEIARQVLDHGWAICEPRMKDD